MAAQSHLAGLEPTVNKGSRARDGTAPSISASPPARAACHSCARRAAGAVAGTPCRRQWPTAWPHAPALRCVAASTDPAASRIGAEPPRSTAHILDLTDPSHGCNLVMGRGLGSMDGRSPQRGQRSGWPARMVCEGDVFIVVRHKGLCRLEPASPCCRTPSAQRPRVQQQVAILLDCHRPRPAAKTSQTAQCFGGLSPAAERVLARLNLPRSLGRFILAFTFHGVGFISHSPAAGEPTQSTLPWHDGLACAGQGLATIERGESWFLAARTSTKHEPFLRGGMAREMQKEALAFGNNRPSREPPGGSVGRPGRAHA